MRRNRLLQGAILLMAVGAVAVVLWRQGARQNWPARFDDHRVFAAHPAADSAGQAAVPSPGSMPQGEVVRLPVTRDAWFSRVGREADCNLGGATRLKLKSSEEFSLVDLDPAPLRGRAILGATLHLRLAGDEVLRRVTVSSLAADWVEGNSAGYRQTPGASSFNFKVHPRDAWSFPGSDLSSVVLGNGHTWWWMADAMPPDLSGWQRLAVEPALVAARVAGVSHGFLLFDDTGSEWSVAANQFQLRKLPERFVHSRERGPAWAPYFTVVLGQSDLLPPGACAELQLEAEATLHLPRGQFVASWLTPADEGSAGTIGFLAELEGKPVPRYLVPMAGKPGQRVFMHVRDLAIDAARPVELKVRAVDGAGNLGQEAALRLRASDYSPLPLPGEAPQIEAGAGPLPRLAGCQLAIIDLLDKIHPETGELTPDQPPDYLAANHLWSAARRRLMLHAARNEFTGFQLVASGRASEIRAELRFSSPGFKTRWSLPRHVPSASGPLPDPAVPITGPVSLPGSESILRGQKHAGLLCEVWTSDGVPPGDHQGRLAVTVDSQRLEIPVVIRVWNFALPDALSFVPELNCYRLPSNEREYYRLAHEHRAVVNRLPYAQRGEVALGCAPEYRGGALSWFDWDERFGPLLDGSAFADLVRPNEPVECFYLPVHENWPLPVDGNYNGSYWADQAFTPAYRAALVDTVRQFAEHIAEKRWNRTIFQLYLNNKINFKLKGWNQGSSPWLLDEPLNFQDFWAVRWFGKAFHEGLAAAKVDAPILFRADVSRPEWQRDSLDEVLDYNVVGAFASRRYRRLLLDRAARLGHLIVDYGTANAIETSNVQSAAWCLEAWSLGSDGLLPWKAVGNADSWNKADPTALIYPGEPAGIDRPVASLRLKALLRGQQDVEYLNLLARLLNAPRWALGAQIQEALELRGEARGTGDTADEDAGTLEYSRLRPQDLWSLRMRVGQYLSRIGGVAAGAGRTVPPRRNRVSVGGYVTVGETPYSP